MSISITDDDTSWETTGQFIYHAVLGSGFVVEGPPDSDYIWAKFEGLSNPHPIDPKSVLDMGTFN